MLRTVRNILGSKFLGKIKTITISPERKAISLTIGFYLGIFPIVGTTTILCLAVILIFRLNPVLTLTMNWVVYPLQIMLIYPFLKAGRLLFFNDTHVLPDISLKQWLSLESMEGFYHLFESVIGGIIVWGIVSLITGFFLYTLFLKISILVSKNYKME